MTAPVRLAADLKTTIVDCASNLLLLPFGVELTTKIVDLRPLPLEQPH